MKTLLITTLSLLQLTFFCKGQDTIRIEPVIHYSSKTDPFRGKEFASKAKYAREEIVFSNTHKQIDYCYYYDNERVCFGTNYELKPDSVLAVNEDEWIYNKQGDHYSLKRYYKGALEFGYAKTLIPLETEGLFLTTSIDKKDTLWKTDYAAVNPANPFDHPKYIFYKTKLEGKVYKPGELNELPAFLNGDSIQKIILGRSQGDYCYGEPLVIVRTMTFVITSTGRIVNIEQGWGNVDMVNCPYYIMNLIRQIAQFGAVMPGKIKGKNVNVRWTIKVDMERPD